MLHEHCWGHHFHGFWIIPLFFMVLMMICAFRMFRRAGYWRGGTWRRTGGFPFGCWGTGQDPRGRWSGETPDQILDQRYASGEITKEQYEQMKQDLDSRRTRPGSGDES